MPEHPNVTKFLPHLQQIALALTLQEGNLWKVGDSVRADTHRVLDGPDGQYLIIKLFDRLTRYHIKGGMGTTLINALPGDQQSPSLRTITVSATRSPKAIASEIRNRLLPTYRQMMAIALAERKVRDAQWAEREAIWERFCDILREDDRERYREELIIYYRGQPGGSADLQIYNDSVNFRRMRVSVEKALRIAQILAE